eukprot:80588-Rhodomonas_salina.2
MAGTKSNQDAMRRGRSFWRQPTVCFGVLVTIGLLLLSATVMGEEGVCAGGSCTGEEDEVAFHLRIVVIRVHRRYLVLM